MRMISFPRKKVPKTHNCSSDIQLPQKSTVSCKPPQRKDKNTTSSAERVAHNHSGLLLMNRFVADDTQKGKKKEGEGIIHIQIQEVPTRRESTRNA